MSFRALGRKLIKHGAAFIRHINKGEPYARTIAESAKPIGETSYHIQNNQLVVNSHHFLRNIGVQVSQQARRILVENVLNRLNSKFGSNLLQNATHRSLYGNSTPLLGLVGVTLASGTSLLSKDEELEGVCWEIRECMSKIQWNRDLVAQENDFQRSPVNLGSFSIGNPLAKGANAVVYSAKQLTETEGNPEPLAIKMMFNYDIQSNSLAILRAMHREIVPAGVYFNGYGISDYEHEVLKRTRYLPPHPNIVKIFSVFTDFVPELNHCRELYPAALPRRIDPNGEGRNMSLFLLMKRYDQNLQEYLKSSELLVRTSVFLLAQLLEGIVHMVNHNIAHRDLKSDNILLDLSEPKSPMAVISDFGCCLAEKRTNLTIPYTTDEIDKGGNTALMAPEIICQKPGTFNILNYSKSDLWASGALAYEIFGASNPFYGNTNKLVSINYEEEELPDLPQNVPWIFNKLVKNLLRRDPNKRLDPEVAANVCQLFLWAPSSWLRIGERSPEREQILEWLLNLSTKILCEGKSTICNNEIQEKSSSGSLTYPEYLLIFSFLCRSKLSNIKSALNWIQEDI